MLHLSSSPQLDNHETGPSHPERPERVGAVLEGIKRADLVDAVVPLPPRRATRQELERVHTIEYLHALEDFCHAGGGPLDVDTIASPGSWDTALLAAGGALEAVEALAGAGGGVGFVAHRPPGPHATADQ